MSTLSKSLAADLPLQPMLADPQPSPATAATHAAYDAVVDLMVAALRSVLPAGS